MSKVFERVGAGSANPGTIKIRDKAKALMFSISDTTGAAIDYTAILATLWVQSPQLGVKTKIHEKTSLADLLEACSIDLESFIEENHYAPLTENGAAAVIGTATLFSVLGKYDLTNDFKGVDLGQDDELWLDLEGIPVGAGTSVLVYALESNETSQQVREYVNLTTGQFLNQKFGTAQAEVMLIERSGNFQGVEIGYSGGRNVKMSGIEIDMATRTSHGIVKKKNIRIGTMNNPYFGQDESVGVRNYILDLSNADYVQVNTNGSPVKIILQK